MVLVMLCLVQFYNFCFPSMVMEVEEGLSFVLTILSSKLFLSGSLKTVNFIVLVTERLLDR